MKRARRPRYRADLPILFVAHQAQLVARLRAVRDLVRHGTAKGDAAELDWIGMLETYLPERYHLSRAFIIDSKGGASEQIDIVIHDRQYSPLMFDLGNASYIPAESVYAVLEVKTTVSRNDLRYAGEKAGSVRRLHRTSTKIPNVGGRPAYKKPARILAGILGTDCAWRGNISGKLRETIADSNVEGQLDLGCIAARAGFEASFSGHRLSRLRVSSPEFSVSFFLLTLVSRLQRMGTVPAIDVKAYLRALNSDEPGSP